jgi:CheY-like chemotaxis protein/HPt (histidine-containing phosphotransfer) domain-containing protein
MANVDPATNIGEAGVRQLRHDLLNPLNVLFGMTTVLLQTDLTETQRTCVQGCRNAAQRLLDIAQHLEGYQQEQPQRSIDGPAQLADLCSIAVARVDKPFDRDTLLGVVRRLTRKTAPRILLVDDAPDIAVLVNAYLKGTNCTLDVVADGQHAVAQAVSQPYDLVLMDVDLPGLDGATAAHAIRAADLARGARPTPVVALSAMGSGLAPPESDDEEDLVVLDDPDTAPLVPAFLDNRREDVHQMRELLEHGDFARIQSIGHKMKGTGRSYGFTAISRIGADIERSGHEQDAPALERLINDLNSFLSRVRIAAPGDDRATSV